MSNLLPRHPVERFSIQLLPAGDGFALDLNGGRNEAVRLEFPTWMLYKLMRVFPRVDAALHQQHEASSSALPAYPVVAWTVEPSGIEQGVAMCLRNDHAIESAFHFELGDARFLHRALGKAIASAAAPPRHPARASKIS